MGTGATAFDLLGIAAAFGLAIVAMDYGMIGVASNPKAVAELWLFIIDPLLGGGAAGWMFKNVFSAASSASKAAVIPAKA